MGCKRRFTGNTKTSLLIHKIWKKRLNMENTQCCCSVTDNWRGVQRSERTKRRYTDRRYGWNGEYNKPLNKLSVDNAGKTYAYGKRSLSKTDVVGLVKGRRIARISLNLPLTNQKRVEGEENISENDLGTLKSCRLTDNNRTDDNTTHGNKD